MFKRKRKLILPPTSEVTKIKYIVSSSSSIGKRSEQQDCFDYAEGINSNIGSDLIAVLCDGMGGLENGALTSRKTTELMMCGLKEIKEDFSDEIQRVTQQTADSMAELACKMDQLRKMGSTMVAVVCRDGFLYFANVGDSRIYLIRAGKIMQLTSDHNLRTNLMELVEKNLLTITEIDENPDANKLTSYIGQAELECLDVCDEPVALQAGDKILLASDGLFNTMSGNEILEACMKGKPQALSTILINEVLRKDMPNQDNVSIIAITYEGE